MRGLRLPIRAWAALSGVGLALVFAVLVAGEVNPPWSRYQRAFFEAERLEAERAVEASEAALMDPATSARLRELTSAVATAEQALASHDAGGDYTRARQDLANAERHLAAADDALRRLRADYQSAERDVLLAVGEEASARRRRQLADLGVQVAAITENRNRLAAARDDADLRVRALTANLMAARDALDLFGAPLVRARAELAAARRKPPVVQQLLVGDLGRVDRCPSCHIASTRVRPIDTTEPLRPHVGRYLEEHPPERFGCTICHGGQGRATRLPAAHGRVPHWDEPLLTQDLIGARCAVCHKGRVVPGEPYATAGRTLFVDAGCHGCHEVEGLSASRIGPSLQNAGAKLRPGWLAWWLRDPSAYLPRTRMPNFRLNDQEVADISAFLLGVEGRAPERGRPGQTSATVGAVKAGETLFKEARCVSCHSVNGRGGNIGPDLGRVASKVQGPWLIEFLRDPARLSPGTKMPRYRFTETQIADLAAYISSEFRDFDEEAWPPVPTAIGRPAEGRQLVRYYGCFGCHEIQGFERTGRVGASLTGYAEKPVDRLDFGLRRDVPRTWRAWTDAKLQDPRRFRDGLKMPSFRLTDAERFSLLIYLGSLTEQQPPASFLREAQDAAAYQPEGRFGELVDSLNCLTCHSIRGRGGSLAPDLTREGSRVRPGWLRRFLDKPDTIRVHLQERMPRFWLAPVEIDVIVRYIENVLVDAAVPQQVFAPGEITPELVDRGRRLYDQYACYACHQIGMEGGAVGPDLTGVADRLTVGWIYAWLRRAQQLAPAVPEPVYKLSDEQARAITAFLLALPGDTRARR